jgi:hypothetical protein
VSNENPPLREQIKAVGLLAGIAAWVVTMGVGLLFVACLALVFLTFVGALIWLAWVIHWVVGFGVTAVFAALCVSFANHGKT